MFQKSELDILRVIDNNNLRGYCTVNKYMYNVMWILYDISGMPTRPNCNIEAQLRDCVYRESDLSTSNLIIIPCPRHASIIDMVTSLIAIPAIGLVRGRTAMASVTLG